MPKPSVYLETTVISYLVGWLSRDSPLVALNQEFTREWWVTQRDKYELFASPVVVDEVSKGDGKLVSQRLAHLADVQLLEARRRNSREGGNRCAPHRGCNYQRSSVSSVVELHPHRERRHTSARLRHLSGKWLRTAVYMHSATLTEP